jgi:hypothetical protein
MSVTFANAISNTRAPNARRSSRTPWRLLLALLAASLLSLTFAGSAAAGVGTGIPITLGPWWSGSAGFGTISPTAYFDDYGLIHLWGAARQKICVNPRGCAGLGAPNLLGTLLHAGPYAPQRNVFTIAHTNFGTYVDVSILTNGQIWLIDPRPPAVKDYSFVSLEGISYNPVNPDPSTCTQIQLNGNNWSPDFKFNTNTPAACFYFSPGADGRLNGGVHLEGAAVQTTSQPSPFPGALPPNVIGTLAPTPGSAVGWPAYNVYTIAHTSFGTYADVEITGTYGGDTPGQIILIGTRPPGIEDYSFVSLEGINYAEGGGFPFHAGPLNIASDWTFGGIFDRPNSPNFFGAPAPGSYEDSAGIVHLEGGVAACAGCSIAPGDTVGSIPDPSEWPSWNVFEIVHTGSGTYADVEIATDGTIHVIPPRPPAVTDYGYLSLEGLTFAAASPKFFGLAVRGTDQQGATVTVVLRKPRVLALEVRAVHGRRLVKVGVVHLGRHRAGRSQLHWNLHVKGRLLRAGRYQITVNALNGNILSVPAQPGPRTLVVLANGGVRVLK